VTPELVDSYILILIYESLFKRLNELTYSKVKDFYWGLISKSHNPSELKVPDE
jgi:hypothetical protein